MKALACEDGGGDPPPPLASPPTGGLPCVSSNRSRCPILRRSRSPRKFPLPLRPRPRREDPPQPQPDRRAPTLPLRGCPARGRSASSSWMRVHALLGTGLAGRSPRTRPPPSLGHAWAMKAVHGSKTKGDRHDAEAIARLLRGGNFPLAYAYPKERRGLRDLLRARLRLVRQRAELYGHVHTARRQANLPPVAGDPQGRDSAAAAATPTSPTPSSAAASRPTSACSNPWIPPSDRSRGRTSRTLQEGEHYPTWEEKGKQRARVCSCRKERKEEEKEEEKGSGVIVFLPLFFAGGRAAVATTPTPTAPPSAPPTTPPRRAGHAPPNAAAPPVPPPSPPR